jgi:uncharacterized surface protein with fasciclin (FAS1) repeats
VKTAQGSLAKVSVGDKGMTTNNAKVVATDIECTNGAIHVIGTVILPPSKD